jgi:Zn-dependent protease/CBS domain-containing protein
MGGSLRIITIRGIDIRVHWSFVLALAYGAWIWSQIASRSQPADEAAPLIGAMYGFLLVLILFLFVVLHELGHSLAAQIFHIPVRDIVLLPLGGVARIERMPENPWQELIIAAAGPAVNFFLALLMLPLMAGSAAISGVDSLRGLLLSYTAISPLGFVTYLTLTNLLLGLFNLLPAFPMDGGRILRAVLAIFVPYAAATQAAVTIGRILALIMGLAGFARGDFFLVLIAIFIYLGAGQEGSEIKIRAALRNVRAEDAYNREALVLGAGQPVNHVVDIMMTSPQSDFAVQVGSQLVGVVTRDRVVTALKENKLDVPIGNIMDRDVLRVAPDHSLYEVRQEMAQANKTVAAVFDGATYLGLITLADISEAFLILAASPDRSRRFGNDPEPESRHS